MNTTFRNVDRSTRRSVKKQLTEEYTELQACNQPHFGGQAGRIFLGGTKNKFGVATYDTG